MECPHSEKPRISAESCSFGHFANSFRDDTGNRRRPFWQFIDIKQDCASWEVMTEIPSTGMGHPFRQTQKSPQSACQDPEHVTDCLRNGNSEMGIVNSKVTDGWMDHQGWADMQNDMPTCWPVAPACSPGGVESRNETIETSVSAEGDDGFRCGDDDFRLGKPTIDRPSGLGWLEK